MAKYLYNGVELPDINTVWTDKETYPYVGIAYASAVSTYMLAISDVPSYFDSSANSMKAKDAGTTIAYLLNSDGSGWTYYLTDDVVAGDITAHMTHFTQTWAGYDILNADGTVYLAASEPVLSAPKPSFVLPDGTELPALPEGCFEKYPYGVIEFIHMAYNGQTADQYRLRCTPVPLYMFANHIVSDGDGASYDTLMPLNNPIPYLTYELSADMGAWSEAYVNPGSIFELVVDDFVMNEVSIAQIIVWSNHDILTATENDDGTTTPSPDLYHRSDVNYRIYGGWLNSMGNQARRLGNVSGELKPGEMETVFKGVSGGGAELNIAYGETAPEDTGKLWVKCNEPTSLLITPTSLSTDETVNTLATLMPEKRYGLRAATVGKKIYLFGGRWAYSGISIATQKSIWVFDTETNEIAQLDVTMTEARQNMGIVTVGTKIYLIGGHYHTSGSNPSAKKTIEVFDTETNTATKLSVSLPDIAYDMGVVAIGSKIYILGGRYVFGDWQKIFVLDTETETLTRISATLPTTETEGEHAAVYGTDIFVFTGTAVYRYDTVGNTVETVDVTLPYSVSMSDFAQVGTYAYFIGGYTSDDIDTIMKYDLSNNSFEVLDVSIPAASYNSGVAAIGSTIYVFGGYYYESYDHTLDTIVTLNAGAELESGKLHISTASSGKTFKLLKGIDAVEISASAAFLGNADNQAEPVEAYLHNGTEWVAIE